MTDPGSFTIFWRGGGGGWTWDIREGGWGWGGRTSLFLNLLVSDIDILLGYGPVIPFCLSFFLSLVLFPGTLKLSILFSIYVLGRWGTQRVQGPFHQPDEDMHVVQSGIRT